MIENEISNKVIGLAIEIHRKLGPGLLESAYKECLNYELETNGLLVEREKPVPIVYKGVKLDHGYRIDLLVNEIFVIEIKCVDSVNDIHRGTIINLLKAGGLSIRSSIKL